MLLAARPFALSVFFSFGCGWLPSGHEEAGRSGPLTAKGAKVPAGARGRTAYYEMRVSVPDDCGARGADAPARAFARLGVEVTIVAASDVQVQVPANPYYALLLDEEGHAYEAMLGGCEPALPNRLLENGESARGWLTFDVPENSRKLQLAYAPRLTLLPERTNAPILSHDIVAELVFELGR